MDLERRRLGVVFGLGRLYRGRPYSLGEIDMGYRALTELFAESLARHSHLCPRQILGVRMGLLGMHRLGFDQPPTKKRLLIITETDGCFADGLSATTDCTVGHRSLRVEDYGKTAAVFVDTVTGQALRLAPALNIRQQAYAYAPGEPRHYFAQMQAYQIMPDEVMFTVQPVALNSPVADIVSQPGVRVNCDACGEEVINEREINDKGLTLCRACARGAYYHGYAPTGETLFHCTTFAAHGLSGGD
jgi:formylmethanofuran dehydrogenase subunit E